MRGQVVVVKDFAGNAVTQRIWSISGNIVFVTSEKGYRMLESGSKTPWPIGVPASDVFEHSGGQLPSKVNWSKMRHVRIS